MLEGGRQLGVYRFGASKARVSQEYMEMYLDPKSVSEILM